MSGLPMMKRDSKKSVSNFVMKQSQSSKDCFRLWIVYDLGRSLGTLPTSREHRIKKTVHAAGKKLAQVYLEAYPDTEPAIRQQLEQIMSMELDDPLDVVDAYP